MTIALDTFCCESPSGRLNDWALDEMSGSMVEVIGSSTTPRMGRRSMALADIDPKYVSQSGIWEASEVETSRGSIRIQHLTTAAVTSSGSRPSSSSAASVSGVSSSGGTNPRFPKLEECAHFHYDCVELPALKIQIRDDPSKPISVSGDEPLEKCAFSIEVTSGGQSWAIRRTHANVFMLDEQLHRCVWDRSFSLLEKVVDVAAEGAAAAVSNINSSEQEDHSSSSPCHHNDCRAFVTRYLARLSELPTNKITCGTVLSWLELDNRGRHIVSSDESAINTPAVAAAHAVRKYTAQAPDEISFEVGDMISVIDMPPPEESIWWRGKRGFHVGFFPRDYVEVIGDKIPAGLPVVPSVRRLQRLSVTSSTASTVPDKPVLRKHGKLIAFFRSFILSRPSRRRLKQSGILRERVFSCDLAEHLLNSGNEIPTVLLCCAEFIEKHGIVDGVYRLSGITSNIQKLRNAFDEDKVPNLEGDAAIKQDIHAVSSLLKMYFRELPNPLCTYQLYEKFVAAAKSSDEERLFKMREVVHELPPPHYRTLQYLMKHLSRVAQRSKDTGMTPKNMAIVWAPNLIRCKELEAGGVAALKGIGVQAVVTEYLIRHADLIFNDKLPSNYPTTTTVLSHRASSGPSGRPKSLAISSPIKLMSLEEAQDRVMRDDRKFIDVGGGPSTLPPKYHTVIELPGRRGGKNKRSPMGWKHFFSRNRSFSKPQRKAFGPGDITVITRNMPVAGPQGMQTNWAGRLRPVKSVESLVSSPLYNTHTHHKNEPTSSSSPQAINGGRRRDLDSESVMEEMESPLSKSSPATPTAASATLTDVHVMFHNPPQTTMMNGNNCSDDSRSLLNPKTHNRSISHDSYFEFGEFRNGNPVYIDETLEEETMSQEESSSKLSLEGLSSGSGLDSNLASPIGTGGNGHSKHRSKSEERERSFFKRSSPVTPPPSVASLIPESEFVSKRNSSASSPTSVKSKTPRPSKWRDSEVQTSHTKLSDVGVCTGEDDMVSLLQETKSVATSSISLSLLGTKDNNINYEVDKNSSFEDESSEMSTPEDENFCSTNIVYSPLVNEISSTSSAEQFDQQETAVSVSSGSGISLFVCPLYEAGVTVSEFGEGSVGSSEKTTSPVMESPIPSLAKAPQAVVGSPVYENVSKIIQAQMASPNDKISPTTTSVPASCLTEESIPSTNFYENDRIYQNEPIAPARRRPTTLITSPPEIKTVEPVPVKEESPKPVAPEEELYSGEHYENMSESDYGKAPGEGNIYEDIDESESLLGRYETVNVPASEATVQVTPPVAPPRTLVPMNKSSGAIARQRSEDEETHYESVRFYHKIDEKKPSSPGKPANHYSEIEESPPDPPPANKCNNNASGLSPLALSPMSQTSAHSSASPSSPSNSRTEDMVTYLEVQTPPCLKLCQGDSLEDPEQSLSSSSASATKEPNSIPITPIGGETPENENGSSSQSSSAGAGTPNSSTEEEGEIRHIDSPLVVENPLYSLQVDGGEEAEEVSINESISISFDVEPRTTDCKGMEQHPKPLGRCSSAPLSETKHDFVIITEDILNQSDDGRKCQDDKENTLQLKGKISLCKRLSEPSLSSCNNKTDQDGSSGALGTAWKVADAKRLANRKQSVKELLSKFEGRRESCPSPGGVPGLPRPASGRKSSSPGGSLKGSFGSGRFQHHRFSMGDILMTQSLSSAEDLDSNSSAKGRSSSMIRSDTFPELRSTNKSSGSSSASKENVLVQIVSDSESLEDCGGLVPEKVQQALRVAMSSVDMNDPSTRERIEKYKEERRTFLRQKITEGISQKSPTSPIEGKYPSLSDADGSLSPVDSVFSTSSSGKVTTTTTTMMTSSTINSNNSTSEAPAMKLLISDSPRKRAFTEGIPPTTPPNSTKTVKKEDAKILQSQPIVAKIYSPEGPTKPKKDDSGSPQEEINVKEKIAMWTHQKRKEVSRSTHSSSCTEISKEMTTTTMRERPQESYLIEKNKPVLRREVTTSSIEIKSKVTRVGGNVGGGGGLGRTESGKKIKDMAAFFEGKKF